MSKYTSCFELAIDHSVFLSRHFLKFLHVTWLAKVVAMISKRFCNMAKVLFRNFEQFEQK